jgi:hypothetical protein
MSNALTVQLPLGTQVSIPINNQGPVQALVDVGGGVGGVASFAGRTGVVVPQTGDYAASQIGNDSLAPGTTVADALTNGRDLPAPDVATTGNVALTGTPANIDTGVSLVSGVTIIFVWLQTDPKQNGFYLFNSGGAWTLITTPSLYRPAQPFQIAGGASWGGRTAYLKNATQPILGTSNVIFNVDLQIVAPTQLGQFLQYDAAGNQLKATGIKSALLTDSDATIAIATAYNFILAVPLTANRTITLDAAGGFVPAVITIDIQVTLAFTLAINNSLGNLFTFLTGSKWIGGFTYSGGNWGAPSGVQGQ